MSRSDEEGFHPHPGDPWHPGWGGEGDEDVDPFAPEPDEVEPDVADRPKKRGRFGRRKAEPAEAADADADADETAEEDLPDPSGWEEYDDEMVAAELETVVPPDSPAWTDEGGSSVEFESAFTVGGEVGPDDITEEADVPESAMPDDVPAGDLDLGPGADAPAPDLVEDGLAPVPDESAFPDAPDLSQIGDGAPDLVEDRTGRLDALLPDRDEDEDEDEDEAGLVTGEAASILDELLSVSEDSVDEEPAEDGAGEPFLEIPSEADSADLARAAEEAADEAGLVTGEAASILDELLSVSEDSVDEEPAEDGAGEPFLEIPSEADSADLARAAEEAADEAGLVTGEAASILDELLSVSEDSVDEEPAEDGAGEPFLEIPSEADSADLARAAEDAAAAISSGGDEVDAEEALEMVAGELDAIEIDAIPEASVDAPVGLQDTLLSAGLDLPEDEAPPSDPGYTPEEEEWDDDEVGALEGEQAPLAGAVDDDPARDDLDPTEIVSVDDVDAALSAIAAEPIAAADPDAIDALRSIDEGEDVDDWQAYAGGDPGGFPEPVEVAEVADVLDEPAPPLAPSAGAEDLVADSDDEPAGKRGLFGRRKARKDVEEATPDADAVGEGDGREPEVDREASEDEPSVAETPDAASGEAMWDADADAGAGPEDEPEAEATAPDGEIADSVAGWDDEIADDAEADAFFAVEEQPGRRWFGGRKARKAAQEAAQEAAPDTAAALSGEVAEDAGESDARSDPGVVPFQEPGAEAPEAPDFEDVVDEGAAEPGLPESAAAAAWFEDAADEPVAEVLDEPEPGQEPAAEVPEVEDVMAEPAAEIAEAPWFEDAAEEPAAEIAEAPWFEDAAEEPAAEIAGAPGFEDVVEEPAAEIAEFEPESDFPEPAAELPEVPGFEDVVEEPAAEVAEFEPEPDLPEPAAELPAVETVMEEPAASIPPPPPPPPSAAGTGFEDADVWEEEPGAPDLAPPAPPPEAWEDKEEEAPPIEQPLAEMPLLDEGDDRLEVMPLGELPAAEAAEATEAAGEPEVEEEYVEWRGEGSRVPSSWFADVDEDELEIEDLQPVDADEAPLLEAGGMFDVDDIMDPLPVAGEEADPDSPADLPPADAGPIDYDEPAPEAPTAAIEPPDLFEPDPARPPGAPDPTSESPDLLGAAAALMPEDDSEPRLWDETIEMDTTEAPEAPPLPGGGAEAWDAPPLVPGVEPEWEAEDPASGHLEPEWEAEDPAPGRIESLQPPIDPTAEVYDVVEDDLDRAPVPEPPGADPEASEWTQDVYTSAVTMEHRGLAEDVARASTEDTELQALSAAMPGLETGVVGFEDVEDLGTDEAYVPPARSDLGARILTGLILVSAFLGALWADGRVLAGFIGVMLMIGLTEYFTTLRHKGYAPLVIFGYLGGVGALAGTWVWGPIAVPGAILSTAVVVFFFYAFASRRRDAMVNGGLTVMGMAWITGTVAFAMPIIDSEDYRVLVFALVASTVAMDVGAYGFGRAWGSAQMAPVLSPNKSIEGLAGGIVLAIGVAVGIGYFMDPFDIQSGAALGLVVAVAAPLGDLAESMFKRSLGVKDMGAILPGHGGILDRIDAFLFVIPPVWVLYEFLGYLT